MRSYVVVAKREVHPYAGWTTLSRWEVATLEEARRAAGRACLGSTPLNLENIEQARMLPGSGGIITLPNGTIVEVGLS